MAAETLTEPLAEALAGLAVPAAVIVNQKYSHDAGPHDQRCVDMHTSAPTDPDHDPYHVFHLDHLGHIYDLRDTMDEKAILIYLDWYVGAVSESDFGGATETKSYPNDFDVATGMESGLGDFDPATEKKSYLDDFDGATEI